MTKADMKKKKMQQKMGWTGTGAQGAPQDDTSDDEMDFREQKKRAFREDEARARR